MSAEAIQPNKHKIQETNPDGFHTVLLVGGLSEGIATQSALAESLSNEHFRVISFDYTTDTAPEGTKFRHHDAKSRQTTEILTGHVPSNEKATIFAHSEGAVFALEAALAHPDKVDRLILSNPAGLLTGDTMPHLIGRFATETIRKTLTLKKTSRVQNIEGTKHLVKHPTDFLGDAADIANTDITDKLQALQAKGVKVDLLVSAKDQVFPWKKQEDYFKNQSKERFDFNSVSSYFNPQDPTTMSKRRFAGKWAGHDQPINYPDETAKLVHQLVGEGTKIRAELINQAAEAKERGDFAAYQVATNELSNTIDNNLAVEAIDLDEAERHTDTIDQILGSVAVGRDRMNQVRNPEARKTLRSAKVREGVTQYLDEIRHQDMLLEPQNVQGLRHVIDRLYSGMVKSGEIEDSEEARDELTEKSIARYFGVTVDELQAGGKVSFTIQREIKDMLKNPKKAKSHKSRIGRDEPVNTGPKPVPIVTRAASKVTNRFIEHNTIGEAMDKSVSKKSKSNH